MKKYVVHSELWRWPGVGGWHFVTLDRELSASIKKGARPYGSGFIKIRATLGKTTWDTALFPHTRSRAYLISVKAAVRKKEGVYEGDVLTISFAILNELPIK